MPGVWEIEADWRRLKRELAAWRTRRARADALGQHRSQLDAAYTLIDRALEELRAPIAATTGDSFAAAEPCRVHERRLAWLGRLWDFFRDRFDQRDDASLAPLLRAADEVVWSCHCEPLAALATPGSPSVSPPPLPYVEPGVTPEVFPHGLVPGSLRRDVDAPFLRRALDQLPFAVVRVPSSCVTAPWWLVHLGHEVGHVMDARLLGYDTRAAAIAALGFDDDDTTTWAQWSGELFADVYAVLMHGQWAVWALAIADTHDDAGMRARRDAYPPPVIRLLLMAGVCHELGGATGEIATERMRWQALVDGDTTLTRLIAQGTRVVAALLGLDVRRTPWRTLAAWNAASWERRSLGAWTTTMGRRPAAPEGRPQRAWARALVAASVLRRRDAEPADGGFDGARIADDLLTWLPAVREPGSRAADDAVTAVAARQGVALAAALMDAEPLP